MKLFLAIASTLFFFTLNAEVQEAKHFNEVEKHTGIDTLLLLDIDDTLLSALQILIKLNHM